jgi:hypothetical protein
VFVRRRKQRNMASEEGLLHYGGGLIEKDEYPRCPKTPDVVALGSVAEVKTSETGVVDKEEKEDGVIVYPELLACGLTEEELEELESVGCCTHHCSERADSCI